MTEPTKSKQFVTHNVPGFEDGHPLTLRPQFDMRNGMNTRECELMGGRKTEQGIQLIAIIPATPDAWAEHVRVKIAHSPTNPGGFL